MKQKGLIVSSDNLLSSYKDLSDIEFVIIRLGFTDFNTKKTKHIDSKFYENYELSKKEKSRRRRRIAVNNFFMRNSRRLAACVTLLLMIAACLLMIRKNRKGENK